MEQFFDQFQRQALKAEEEVLQKVLFDHLKTDLAYIDYSKLKRVQKEGVHDHYVICYDTAILGHIRRIIDGTTYRVEFSPMTEEERKTGFAYID